MQNSEIIDTINTSLYWKDNNGCYLNCNKYFLNYLGVKSKKEIIGKTDYDLYSKVDADKIRKVDISVMTNGTFYGEELIMIHGEMKTFLTSKIRLLDAKGNVTGISGNSVDITEVKKKIEFEKQQVIMDEESKVMQVIDLVDASIYWKDKDGRYLGCNKYVLEMAGLTNREEIIGKTDFELVWKNDAPRIRKIDELVIETGSYQGEEYTSVANAKEKFLLTSKNRLLTHDGKVIGIAGTSLDITAKKDAERLKLENAQLEIDNKTHKAVAAAQENFRISVGQMVHDIRTPLSTLQMTVQSTREIPEEKRIALRDATIAITDITGQLLRQYEPEDKSGNPARERQIVIASTIVSSVAGDGRRRYKDRPIKFIYEPTQLNAFLFIKAEPIDLKRSISNLINNAVEALPSTGGTIELKLTATDEWVSIKLLDDGAGIPQEILEKIKKKEVVSHGKAHGHGLGLSVVRDMIEANHGEFDIFSSTVKMNHGTTITLRFPRVMTPNWAVEELNFMKNDIVIILDDDVSIHGGWDSRLNHVLEKVPTIQVNHFYQGQYVIDFVEKLSEEEKQNVYFLSDYELIGQGLNGLQVIAKTKIKRSILVTSHYANVEVRKEALQSQVRVLPKDLVHLVAINVVQEQVKGELVNVHMVFVDDEKAYTKNLVSNYYSHLLTDSYSDPFKFLDEVDKYPKETTIVLDNYYYMEDGGTYKIDGVMLAEKLHAKGFTKLILLSGEKFSIPDFLKLILKTDGASLAKLDKLYGQ